MLDGSKQYQQYRVGTKIAIYNAHDFMLGRVSEYDTKKKDKSSPFCHYRFLFYCFTSLNCINHPVINESKFLFFYEALVLCVLTGDILTLFLYLFFSSTTLCHATCKV